MRGSALAAVIAIIALQGSTGAARSAAAATTPMAPAPVTTGSVLFADGLLADGFEMRDLSRWAFAARTNVAVEAPYQAIDVSTALGFGQTVETWSACEANFVGGDRLRDVIVIYHDARTPGSPTNLPGAQLFRNMGTSYRIVFSWPRFSPQGKVPDRHDCIAGDWNADGRMDVYFTAGRGGGNGVKNGRANELWIQEAPNVWVDRAAEWGVEDLCGRSHHGARLDANLDGLPDLYVGNAPPRDDPQDPCDAIPGSEQSHLYLNVAGKKFVDATQTYGLTGPGGVNCASAPDYNKDGARDLVVCRAAGLLVLRNQGGSRFVDERAALGIPTMNFSDAEAADVTNDGIRDLVTIVGSAVQVRTSMSGTARTIYSTTHGERIAIGDATRDGRRDVYVLRSNPLNRTNPQDVVLVGTGTAWWPVAVPNANGIGDFALYLTGLQGYLVGNGRAESVGKLQAITVGLRAGG